MALTQEQVTRKRSVPSDVAEGLATMRAFRLDLPDGMWDEVEETWQAVKDYILYGDTLDWDGIREAVEEACSEWGYPSPCNAVA